MISEIEGVPPFVENPKSVKKVKDKYEIPTKCHYCNGIVEAISNDQIYNGKAYGHWPFAYRCKDCHASVGMHPNTYIPLGSLADRETKEYRKRAKEVFIQLYKMKLISRGEAYERLAKKLGIDKSKCHFGHFDVETAKKCVKLSKEIMEDVCKEKEKDRSDKWIKENKDHFL